MLMGNFTRLFDKKHQSKTILKGTNQWVIDEEGENQLTLLCGQKSFNFCRQFVDKRDPARVELQRFINSVTQCFW